MEEVIPQPVASAVPGRALPSGWWLLGVLLGVNAVLLWLGLSQDAITVSKTLKKEFLGLVLRIVDERQTFSVFSAIWQLRVQGDYLLFTVLLAFSVVFPCVKWLGNLLLWVRLGRPGGLGPRLTVFAHQLHWLGKWSMIEVFVAALLCVLLKLGDVARFRIEPGMYWFFAAVLLSLVNALWTGRLIALRPEPISISGDGGRGFEPK